MHCCDLEDNKCTTKDYAQANTEKLNIYGFLKHL